MIYDLIIVGAGPAGVTAAIYAARKELKFTIISPEVGGQLLKTSIIENYPGYQEILGIDLARKFEEHFAEFKFDFHQEEVFALGKTENFFSIKSAQSEFKTKSIIWATGSKPKKLEIPREKELTAKGVTYCTTCDGPFFKNKDVVVVGGGNTALESILQLSQIAKKVYVVNLAGEFTGDKILIKKVQKLNNVETFLKTQVLEIVGENVVEGLRIQNKEGKKTLKIQGVFVNIGYTPQSFLLKKLVKITDYGEIKINAKGETSFPGIFAAGDCTNIAYKQIITSAGAGATAALSAFAYLSRL